MTDLCILLGQGEQYYEPDEWRQLIRDGRLTRGMILRIRRDGLTRDADIESVSELATLLNELDPRDPSAEPRPPSVPSSSAQATPDKTVPPAVPPLPAQNAQSPPLAPVSSGPPSRGEMTSSLNAVVVPQPASSALPTTKEWQPTRSRQRSTRPTALIVSLSVLGLSMLVVGVIVTMMLSARQPPPRSVKSPSPPSGLTVDKARPEGPVAPAFSPGLHSVATAAPPSAVATPLQTPSFDCTQARGWAAPQVCRDATLATFDRQMAALYFARIRTASEDQVTATRLAQRAWLSQRETCRLATDPAACLRSAYEQRIARLSSAPEPAPPTPPQSQPSPPPEPVIAPPTPPAQDAGDGDGETVQSLTSAVRACNARRDWDCSERNLATLLQLARISRTPRGCWRKFVRPVPPRLPGLWSPWLSSVCLETIWTAPS